MDIVSHGLCGALIGRFDNGRRLGPGTVLAAVAGALIPDCDLIIAGFGWDRYLLYHEAGTHAIVMSPVLASGVALCVRLMVQRSHFGRLWLAALAGVLFGHLSLDLISGADMRLLAPFSDVRLAPHLVAQADLLVLAILATGFAIGFRHPRAALLCSAAVLMAVLAVKQQTQRLALAEFERSRGSDPARTPVGHPDAVNGSVFFWTIYERDGDRLRAWMVNARTGFRSIQFERRTDPTLSEHAAAVPAIRSFIALLHLPVVRFESSNGRHFALWSDLRDCNATRCTVSVGAEIDSSGRPIRQVIEVGPLRQWRALPSGY
jgi:membrane-bound metal-dependent hydrolase YbcI (DUF457 family)